MLKDGDGGDGRREVCHPARGCGVEPPRALRLPRRGHGVVSPGMPTRRDLRQCVRHDRRSLASGLTADDMGDLVGSPAGVEHSCDVTLEQGAQPARHQIPPAAQGPSPEPVRRSETAGVCRHRSPRIRRAPPPGSARRLSRQHRPEPANPERPDWPPASSLAPSAPCAASTASCDGALCSWYPSADDAEAVSHRSGWSPTSTVTPIRGAEPSIAIGHEKERSGPSAEWRRESMVSSWYEGNH